MTCPGTVNEVSFVLEARRPGYSRNLVRSGYLQWDKIIKPGENSGACWRYARLDDDEYDVFTGVVNRSVTDKSTLEWSVTVSHVSFAD